MTLHYAGKHRAPRSVSPARRAGTGLAAAAALGVTTPLALTTLTATPAMAQAPDVPSTSTEAPTQAPEPAPEATAPQAEAPEADAPQAEAPEADAPQAEDETETVSGSGIVQLGDTGDAVEDIQDALGVASDGIFGPDTEAAVKAFQGANGLAVDGIVGPDTRAALADGGSQESAPAASTESSSTESAPAASTESSSTESASQAGSSAPTSSDAGATETRTAETASRSTERTAVSSSSPSSASGVLGTAASLVGTPYVMGGESPSGFDCSGFTQYVFAQHGIDLPRMTGDQQNAVTPVSNPQPGDLVFFGSPAYHVGIYAGDGMMYDAGNERVDTTKRAIWTDNVSYGRP